MSLSKRAAIYIIIFVALAALALWASATQARAQGAPLACRIEAQANGGFVLHCEPPATATPVPPAPTATPMPTSTAAPAWTATPVPPTATATAIPPTATATATALASGAYTANVPLLDVAEGDPALDANNWAILWAGKVSPAGGYTQLRLAGAREGLLLYAQAMTPQTGGGFGLSVNGRAFDGRLRDASGWQWGGTGVGWRGFGAYRLVPWAQLGGRPQSGDVWPLTLTAADGATWAGALRFGAPDYAGRPGTGAITVPVVADASLGGGTDCAWDDDPLRVPQLSPDWFRDWGAVSRGAWGSGLINLGDITYANVQAQWDTTDWPCYSRYIARWDALQLPAGATVTGAWLDVYFFGYAYPGPNDVQEFAPHQVTQAYAVEPGAWEERGVTWDNAPAAVENISRTALDWCADGVDCRGVRSVDVTEIVRRGGDTVLLYTAAGQYHSGRYFYTREGSARPVLRVAYTMGEQPTWTATPTAPAATATSTSTPTATWLPPTASPTMTAGSTPTAPSSTPTPMPPVGVTCTKSVGPGGLRAAVTAARPGDVLCLADGVYTEAIQPTGDGTQARPITIRALNDGRVTIDGQGQRIPLMLYRNWWVVEGLVLRNGTVATARVEGDNNVLRRVSAYDASTDENSAVVFIWGDSNLLEDVVAAGTGRYSLEIFEGAGNTIRRGFAMWGGWDGRAFCGVSFPNGYSVGVYNASNTTVEHVIAYSKAPNAGIMVQANSDSKAANNNLISGSMALLAGRDTDGSTWTYGTGQAQPTSRPGPSDCPTNITQWSWGTQRVGFLLWGQGTLQNNVFRDVIGAWSMGPGFAAVRPYAAGTVAGNRIERGAFFGNGEGAMSWEGKQLHNGLGVQVVAGAPVRANLPPVPWPMGSRIAAELGVNVDAVITGAIEGAE